MFKKRQQQGSIRPRAPSEDAVFFRPMDRELSTLFSKLDDLLNAGVITPEDHQLRKDKLIERYMGGTRFPPMAAPNLPLATAPPTSDKLLCSTHNRVRTPSCLRQVGTAADGSPLWACTPVSQCKTQEPATGLPVVPGLAGAWGPQGLKRPAIAWPLALSPAIKRPRGPVTNWGYSVGQHGPVAAGQFDFNAWAGLDPDKVPCSVHGKLRSLASLVQGNFGEWVCRPDTQCKTGDAIADGTQTLMCAVHQRTRASNYLELGPDGQYRCKQGRECKVKN